jgi:hypothetical protein
MLDQILVRVPLEKISALPEHTIGTEDAKLLVDDRALTATLRLKWEPFHLLITKKKRFEIMFGGSKIQRNCKYVCCHFPLDVPAIRDGKRVKNTVMCQLLYRILGVSDMIHPEASGCHHTYTFSYTPCKGRKEITYDVAVKGPYTVCWLGELVWQSETCGVLY